MTTKTSSKATSMAELMKSVKTTVPSFKKGDSVEGTITKLTSAEILVDIGAKTEAVVLEKDKRNLHNLLRDLQVGQKVTVTILNPESDYGYPVVSLRRFSDEKMWEKLAALQKSQEGVEVIVTEATRGGSVVITRDGISGFLPNSHTSFAEGAQNVVGKNLQVVVLELNKPLRKIIFSQKSSMSKEEFGALVKNIKVGQSVSVTIVNVTKFGLFVTVPVDDKTVEGFIHISEVSWEKIDDLTALYAVGDTVTAEVIDFDSEGRKVNLSLKRLTENPMRERLKQFAKDQKVEALVKKIMDRGVVFDVETDLSAGSGQVVEGFMKKESIPPTTVYKEGETVQAIVSEVDQKRHRLVLTPILLEKPLTYR